MLTTVSVDDVVRQLQALGLSGYEAKAYCALVAAGEPLNGYEIAKRSAVPRASVYETLGKLLARGAAFEVRTDEDSTAYVSLPPDTLLRRLRQDFESHLDDLGKSLPGITSPPAAHLMHNIEGQSAVLERMLDLIHGARDDLYLSLWSTELSQVEDAVEEASVRGVDVSTLVFGDSSPITIPAQQHVFADAETVLQRVGCRLLLVAADRSEVLVGGATADSMWGLYSDDPALVLVVVEFIRHDIAFQRLVTHVGPERIHELDRVDAVLERLATGKRASPGLARRVRA